MQLRLLIEPQLGATYEQQLAIVQEAERLGYDAVLRSDHYLNSGSAPDGPGPSDAWVSLGALARETSSIRLGTLMTCAQFRAPAPLAMTVAQVDQMSGGRIEFGLGAGWFEAEHEAFGLAFPPIGVRFDRLQEQLEIITRFWATDDGATFSHAGRHYQLRDCPGLPKPAQRPGPPVIIGGGGTKRTPELAARFAAEFNVGLVPDEIVTRQFERVRCACEAIGRDPDELIYSTATTVVCARTEQAARQKVADAGLSLAECEELGVWGTPVAVLEKLSSLAETRAQRCYLRLLDVKDLDQVALIAEAVMPALPE